MAVRLGHALYWLSWPIGAYLGLTGIIVIFNTPYTSNSVAGFFLFLAGPISPILGYAARYVLTGIKRPW